MLKKTSIIRVAIIRITCTYRLKCPQDLCFRMFWSVDDKFDRGLSLTRTSTRYSDSNWPDFLESLSFSLSLSLSVCFMDRKNVFTFTSTSLCFFPLEWLTRVCLPIFDNSMYFLHNLHPALFPSFTLVNQDLNSSSSSQLALNKSFLFHFTHF